MENDDHSDASKKFDNDELEELLNDSDARKIGKKIGSHQKR